MLDGFRESLGMPLSAMFGLALLGVPRVIAHDLRLASPLVNALLVFVPIAVWPAIVLWLRAPNAFRTLLITGVIYGVLLDVVHQLLWTPAFGGAAPGLDGNLAGVPAPSAEGLLLRAFAFLSGLVTGVLVGAGTGMVGWMIAKAVPGFRKH
ncbi:hypothetical protein SAMN05216215_1003320 [Saccharopolyspora shandongensis]|uniref:Uncharacterized protein n=1 Tax=Saccharopolyspora shandongensis TaxID=418495 RepID=A0A1H2U3Q1_9PSEU|nr:hypothetical protein [Saccharopolyspora shandongensis]SDW50842.1 hypothetical protein SAMN05216215_1003320 [Saccharopolyspora shandongensis]